MVKQVGRDPSTGQATSVTDQPVVPARTNTLGTPANNQLASANPQLLAKPPRKTMPVHNAGMVGAAPQGIEPGASGVHSGPPAVYSAGLLGLNVQAQDLPLPIRDLLRTWSGAANEPVQAAGVSIANAFSGAASQPGTALMTAALTAKPERVKDAGTVVDQIFGKYDDIFVQG